MLISNCLKQIVRSRQKIKTVSVRCFRTNSVFRNDENDLLKVTTNLKSSYASSTSEFNLVPHTVRDLVDMQAELAPNKMVFGFPHQSVNLTFAELKQRVDAFAENLIEIGLQKGDRIGFALPNCYQLAVAYLASAKLGLISVFLNPAYQLTEFEYMLAKSGTKALIIYDSFKHLNHMSLIQTLCPELDSSQPGQLNSKKLPLLKHIIVLNSPLNPKQTFKGTWSFEHFVKAKSNYTNFQMPYIDIDDPHLILFTSGTTGKPKGALMTNSGLLNSAYLSTRVAGNQDDLKMICNPVPFFHIYGFSSGFLIPLLMQCSIVFPFFFPETVTTMKAIQDYKCVTLRGTPTQFFDLLHHPERKNYDLSSLNTVIFGGSTVPPELLQKMHENFNLKMIVVGYGMTETSFCHSLTNYFDQKKSFKKAFQSIGRPIPYSETKIVDIKTREIVPLNTDGELMIKGPHTFREYWDEKEKTNDAFENGWLKTGDICSMDEEGYLFFKSRDKELIIRGGANLYPAEIETFLRTHSKILDVQVFGVPDERMGEEICAWIKLIPDAEMNAEEIISFCKGKISQFKIPKYIKFVEKFPINANNKILKIEMRKQAILEYNLN